jgi:nucleoside-diphosphate-sugar epimerase
LIKQKKILVVGGTGFLGFHLCKEAIKKKWLVTSISSKKPKKKKIVNKVKYLICDIKKKNNIRKIKDDYDYVVNFGGYVDHSNNKKTYESHYLGLKNLADFFATKNIKSFIQIGSSVEYGFNKSPQDEKDKTSIKQLKSTYGRAKLLATNYLLNLYKIKNFPATILRLYLVYGPHQDINRFIPITIDGCLRNLNFNCSEGTQKRDFVYISDVINVIFKSLKNKRARGEIFNIGTGQPIKIKKIINSIQYTIKKGKPNYGKIKLRKDEILNLYPKINKAKNIINWSPKIKFQNGLKKTINYYKSLK